MADDQTANPANEQSERARKIHRLLEVALQEFGRRGPFGARVDAIARNAGMNKRLLYHYVGNKDALFAAVLERACARVVGQPQMPMPDEWRVICHAAAAGADLGALGALPLARSETADQALGRVLLASLLPELVDRVVENAEPTSTERLESPGRVVPKPRLKLRPELRTAGTAGSQASATRSDSNRSK